MTAWVRTDNNGVDLSGMAHGCSIAQHEVRCGKAMSYGTWKGWPGMSDDDQDHGAA